MCVPNTDILYNYYNLLYYILILYFQVLLKKYETSLSDFVQ